MALELPFEPSCIVRLVPPRFSLEGQRAAIGELDDLPEAHT